MSTLAPMDLNLSADEVLTTTRSVRKRLDFDKPVPREVLMECLDIALQAPTGSNAQGWQWVFVEDAAKKKALADIYRAAANPYLDQPKPSRGDIRDKQMDAVVSSAKYLAQNLEQAPVMMIPVLEGARIAPRPASRRRSGDRCCRRFGVSCWHCAPGAWGQRGPHCTSSAPGNSRLPSCLASRSTATPRVAYFRSPTPRAPTSSWPRDCLPRS